MDKNYNTSPMAERLHIPIVGCRNVGKSSLLNMIVGQDVSIVSSVAGTTTDVVKKPMEIRGLGACVFIDTAGIDDVGALGQQRVDKAMQSLDTADMVIVVISATEAIPGVIINNIKIGTTPIIPIISKTDLVEDGDKLKILTDKVLEHFGTSPILANNKSIDWVDKLLEQIRLQAPKDKLCKDIVGNLAKSGDVVVLVMPQDSSAPKGRLILPQVQTIRELLDKNCVVLCCNTESYIATLKSLSHPPKLIITDSQAFAKVWKDKPKESLLTSFSVLFAGYKGDIDVFIEGANAIAHLKDGGKVLIAEACTHAPTTEDIGRVKIPALLRTKVNPNIEVDVVSGLNFPQNIGSYDLIIHCAGCMFNRSAVLSRIQKAKNAGVPITNYGIAIAYLLGILDKVSY